MSSSSKPKLTAPQDQDDQVLDLALRPTTFDEYNGQQNVKENLAILIGAAKKRKDQAPACTLYENFVVLLGAEVSPVVLPMEKTKVKAARKFYSMMALKGGDMFSFTYKLSTIQEKNADGQTYFNYQVTDIGKKTDPERLKTCEQIWAALQKSVVVTEAEHPEGGEGAAAASPRGAAARY